MDLQRLIKFVKLTNDFQEIERVVLVRNSERWENDSEHSFQLALVAWYLCDSGKLNLNMEKVLKYALAHDLVEIHAGDTFAFDADQAVHDSKQERERQAMEKLSMEYPEFPEMAEIIEGYENKVDEEARFVYALDKILPMMNMYLDGGRTWQRRGVTLQDHIANKTAKVAAHPYVEKYFNLIIELLKKEQNLLWPDKQEDLNI
jgi:putative hydrolases of HD superfamily